MQSKGKHELVFVPV